MITRVFHNWERRLAAAAENRTIRPFDWGLEWLAGIPGAGPVDQSLPEHEAVRRWSAATVMRSAEFFAAPEADYTLDGDTLSYRSAVETPHEANNTVRARYFPEVSPKGRKRAVVVLPQWNAEPGGHVGLCRLLNRFGISALRLSMPYHDARMPPELLRADYIVSANIGRTIAVCRQAVIDTRQAIGWLHQQGYESIGILGTSLGSCLSMLTAAHEPLLKAAALNHVSPYFADVIWRGLSTEHVRASLDQNVTLDSLREMWMPISPVPYLEGVRNKSVLLVYALYDLTFPVDLSRLLVTEFRARKIAHTTGILPCGHYSSGRMPFNLMDGITLSRFLDRALRA
ncbi:MAG: abhydrolase domain-containing 18 [Vicinamibacterales bacterium]